MKKLFLFAVISLFLTACGSKPASDDATVTTDSCVAAVDTVAVTPVVADTAVTK